MYSLYREQFSTELDTSSEMRVAVKKTIIIASIGRSGSHMLGQSMSETGLLERLLEYLNRANLEELRSLL